MVVLLDPIETISWLDILRKNGTSKAFEYGQYLGDRYKDFPNIIWKHGNDLQSWRNAGDDDLVQAVARGIKSIDANHIHTVELNYETSGSLEDKSWAPLIDSAGKRVPGDNIHVSPVANVPLIAEPRSLSE